MRYKIENSNGKTGGAWSETYATLREAGAAMREAMGWRSLVTSGRFMVDGPRGASAGDVVEAVSCYETYEECVADETGARAPRIVKL